MAGKDDLKGVSGPAKAAIMMLAIGEERSARLFAMMDVEEIKELSQAMANLGSINAEIVERLFIEFAGHLSNTGSLVGSYQSTERLLGKTLPKDKVDDVGQAGQRQRNSSGQLPEQRISPTWCRRAEQTDAGTCGSCPG